MNELTYTNSDGGKIELNTGVYRLKEITGIYHAPGQSVLTNVPLKIPPLIYYGHNPGQRTIDVTLVVQGWCTDTLIDNIRALYTHFWVDVRDDELGVLTYTTLNEQTRAIAVTPPQGEDPGLNSWWIASAASTGFYDVTLRFIAPDPTWYDPEETAPAGMNLAGAVPVNYLCTNNGDCDAYPTITYTAGASTATNPKCTDSYGNVFQLSEQVEAGEVCTCVLDPQNLSITNSVDGDWLGKRTSGSRLVKVAPGTHNLVFVGEAGDLAGITVTYNDRYSGHG